MLKVMHVLNTGSYSGAENVVVTLINSTNKDVESVYVSLDGSIREYLSENSIIFRPISKLVVKEIKRVIKEERPNIIHAHDFTAGIICSLATNKPIINHIHNNSPWIKHYSLRSIVYAVSCFKYKKILTVSDSVMDEYVYGKWFKQKTEVVGNPIDIGNIRKLAGNVDMKYDIAFLGRLSLQKNPQLLLDIINDVKKSKTDVSLVMIGDGELREDVKKRIKELNLESNITMVGFQKNPYKYLNQAKILLMPSLWEGYGLAAVEALALGKPVVCSNVGGLPKIVDDSCGKICEGIKDYSSEILNLLREEERYVECSEASKRRAEGLGDMYEYSSRILNIYRNI